MRCFSDSELAAIFSINIYHNTQPIYRAHSLCVSDHFTYYMAKSMWIPFKITEFRCFQKATVNAKAKTLHYTFLAAVWGQTIFIPA